MTTATPKPPAARRSGRRGLIGIGLLAVIGLLAAFAAYVARSMPASPPAEAPPDPVLVRLGALGDHMDAMDATLAHLVDAVRRIQADIGDIRTKLSTPAPLPAPHVVAHRLPRVARVAKPAPVAPAAPPADDTRLLSVDVWDGRPSVVLRAPDGSVRFAQDGETTPLGRVSVGPLASQSVRIERPDGTSVVLHAAEER